MKRKLKYIKNFYIKKKEKDMCMFIFAMLLIILLFIYK